MGPQTPIGDEKQANKGSLTGCIETKPEERSEAPYEPQMVCRGAKMEMLLAWGSLRYERPGG